MNSLTPSALIRPPSTSLAAKSRILKPHAKPKKPPLMRRYECLTEQTTNTLIAPALPLFEAAFSAFARGTVFKTNQGPCPVEDLMPGMALDTVDHGLQPLLWRGMMNIVPNTPTNHPESQQLARVMQGSFGFARPEADLMLGPAAEIVRPAPTGGAPNLTPVTALIDDHTVFHTSPPSSVQVFHLMLPRQCGLIANGVQLASYHPPLERVRLLGPNMKQLFMSFFPHIKRPEDFGPALRNEKSASRDADLHWA
ncbi:Hint domain-containing protein [Thalassobius sp. Cn5-15]|uniref:Hint domain-containing protein n=1 Tax=Thalassobius sp. Cn5-15 TaxID=2917763 RepID=UPI001EF25A31|nr:Hint domain-containing protein [Thalassobius sp. Cn5-15]MCG7493749.1 Hint domain-containing protein [Thalassobius sp. Cn5-15]